MRSSVVAVLVAAALFPANGATAVASSGSAFDRVLRDYRDDAQISACRHSRKTLLKAQQETPDDLEQFAPEFPEALGKAITARDKGRCAAFDPVFKDYRRDGEISPCRHTLRELRVALRQTPDDIPQFASGFPAALRDAIRSRKKDRCPQGKH